MVLMHGALGCTEMWGDMPLRLAQLSGYNVLGFDRQGHGKSANVHEKRTEAYYWFEGVVHTPQVVTEMGIENYFLIGHADGASISLCHAAVHQSKLTGMALFSPRVQIDKYCQTFIKNYVDTPKLQQKLMKLLTRYHGDNAEVLLKKWLELWSDMEFVAKFDLAPLLGTITVPTAVFQGNEDETIEPDHIYKIETAIGDRNCVARKIPTLGFLPYKDNKDMVLGLFLSRLPTGSNKHATEKIS